MEAAAVLKQCPPEHREWVDRLRHGGPLPLASMLDSSPNSWSCPPGDLFPVRSADYLKSKLKIPAGEWLLQPLAFDLLQSSAQISHIMNHPHCRVRAALDAALAPSGTPAAAAASPPSQPFVWAFNIQLGNKTHHSLIFYFVSFSNPPPGSLMQKFLDGDDAYRNSRLKLLLRLPEAPWIAQVVVGERWPVVLLGKAVTCTYMRGKNYIEMDVDAGSSVLTRTAVKLTASLAPLIICDCAFLLEGTQPDELPERILGSVRLNKIEPLCAALINMSEANEGDVPNHEANEGDVPSHEQMPDMSWEVGQADEVTVADHKRKPKAGITAKLTKMWSSSSKDCRTDIKYKRPANEEDEDRGHAE